MMIAALAEPAMLMVIFSVAPGADHSLSLIVDFMLSGGVGLRVSLALALISLLMVAIAENGRIPIDNPATHLELTMVHEAMVLEYSGRHLALIEAGGMLKLVLYLSLIACIFLPLGYRRGRGAGRAAGRPADLRAQAGAGAVLWWCSRPAIAKMRVFRVRRVPGRRLDAGLARRCLLDVRWSRRCHAQPPVRHSPPARPAAWSCVSFVLLYQRRMFALIQLFAIQSAATGGGRRMAGLDPGRAAPFVTAALALVFKAIVIPVALHRIIVRLDIKREIDTRRWDRPDHAGRRRSGDSVDLWSLPVTADADALTREDLALALAVVLLGLLMMITRRNAIGQVIGFMSLENGLILAAAGAKGMPLMVEMLGGVRRHDRFHHLRHLLLPHPRAVRHARRA